MGDTSRGRDADPLAFLAGGGEMGRRIRAFDWAATALGPVAGWPQTLRSALGICLNSNFPIAIYWGPDLVLLYNDEWSPIPGTKHPWALGRPAREAWPEIWHIIQPLFGRVMTAGEATRSRDQLLPMHRHGFTEECYFDYTFSPIRGAGGLVEGVFNAVLETTNRVIGERRLRTLRELGAWKTGEARTAGEACETATHILAQNPHDLPFTLLYLLDGGGRRATLAGLTGLDRDTVAAPAAVDLDSDAPWPLRRVAETAMAVEVDDLPARFGPLPGGAWPESPRRAAVLPIGKSGHAELAGFVVAGVSPRLKLDDEYRGFLDLLAAQVAAAVTNARAYEEERKRAEALAELDRAKTTFFSNVSHEFRTPLTLMLGPAEDALADARSGLPPAQRDRVEVIHRNGLRLQRLVNTLLDFARIEAGRVKAAFEPTDLAAYTADLASNFRSACERAGLRLDVDCPPLGEPAYVDRPMWEKVVLNLLSNAFKFTFDGGIAVTVRRAGDAAELRVRDTGTGIPAHEMPRLFERFHRVENARGRTHEGSGIGLALVHELVKLHGGTIAAESEAGKGTTFTVTVPLGSAHLPRAQVRAGGQDLAPAAAGASPYVDEALGWLPDGPADGARPAWPADGAALPATPPTAEPDAGGDRPRVLVADDNADMRRYVARLLAGRYAVEAVPDGAAALAAIRERAPDLVVSDVMMPRLDGLGLLREMRADPATAAIPVVLLSARAGEDSRIEALEAGADDYLAKPFSARELVAAVAAQVQTARVRRAATASVRASEARLRAMIDAWPSIIFIKDWDGKYLLANQACRSYSGTPPDQMVGKTDFDFLPRAYAERYRQDDLRILRSGRPERYEEEAPIGGVPTAFLTVKFPLRDAAGEVYAVCGIATDITDRKRAEDALREQDRRKDEFLATLAHELRNPLAPLRNGLQVMKLAAADAGAVDRARTMMERQLDQLVRLVDDLLDLSRISRGKIELRVERAELTAVLRQAVETSRPLVEAGGHDLAVTVSPGPVYVDADVTRLAQVLSNLLNNAAKYTDRGGRIELAVRRGGGEAVVSVRDNGIGIPADMLPRVFDIFTQVDRNLDRAQGGLGIGLSIVKRLVEMHRGTVEAHSEGPGRGSEFVVRLPLAPAPAPGGESGDGDGRGPGPRRRVLVVDDNRDAATSLATVLGLLGHETATAFDGLAALEVAPAFRPDLILLDIGMPRLNGYDTARRIRAEPWGRGVALAALTGWGQEEDRRRSQEAGFDHHLTKPVDPARLRALLADLQATTS